MKVNGNGPGSADKARGIGGAGSARSVGDAKAKGGGAKAPLLESDISEKVAISGRGKDAARAKELATAAPELSDEARIAKLKAAIQGGTYKVDAEAIADKLVDDHLFNSI